VTHQCSRIRAIKHGKARTPADANHQRKLIGRSPHPKGHVPFSDATTTPRGTRVRRASTRTCPNRWVHRMASNKRHHRLKTGASVVWYEHHGEWFLATGMVLPRAIFRGTRTVLSAGALHL